MVALAENTQGQDWMKSFLGTIKIAPMIRDNVRTILGNVPPPLSINVENRKIQWKVMQGKSWTDDLNVLNIDETVPELDCTGRPVYNINDLHLDTDVNWGDPEVMKRLCSLILEVREKNGILILNGDVFEWWYNRKDGSSRIIKSADGKTSNAALFRNFLRLLNTVDSVLLEWNHDPKEWYKKSPLLNNMTRLQWRNVIVKHGEKRTLIEHGNRMFLDSDEVSKKWTVFDDKTKWSHPWLVTRLAAMADSTLTRLNLLWPSYGWVNKQMRAVAPYWFQTFWVQRIITGHVHHPMEQEYTHGEKMIVGGTWRARWPWGRGNEYVVIDENGNDELRYTKSTYKYSLFLRKLRELKKEKRRHKN
jgi:UDP-2,3-diacylglucosamine pyrophosphatase LpxH